MDRLEKRLLNPRPGTAAWAAREFGVDLSLLLERLRRTPEQRLLDLEEAMLLHEEIRGAARRK
jgi:hypothetical protein